MVELVTRAVRGTGQETFARAAGKTRETTQLPVIFRQNRVSISIRGLLGVKSPRWCAPAHQSLITGSRYIQMIAIPPRPSRKKFYRCTHGPFGDGRLLKLTAAQLGDGHPIGG